MNRVESVKVENEFPNIFPFNDYNPSLSSPSSPYSIAFSQTRETLCDVESYRNFLYNAITRFRTSQFYKHYKAHIISLGMDRCQLHPHIVVTDESDVASLEMHHHVLTIFDIAFIITEHILNTYGTISTFDLVELIRMEHAAHRVNIVMLCKTCHELYTAHNENFKIPSTIGFGKWWEFLDRYKYGITREIALKIYYMLKNDLYNADSRDYKILKMLELRDNILNWSDYNEKLYRGI